SGAFAVADHQIAHIYVNDRQQLDRTRQILMETPGIATVLDDAGKIDHRIGHARSGDLIAVAQPGAWFTYYYWDDDSRAVDYARTVEIHRKPGYDPVELFLDPSIRLPPLTVGWKLAKRKMGFRSLLDVIPLDAALVKGSHGRPAEWSDDGPALISRQRALFDGDRIRSTDVYELIRRHLVGG